jgi:hypothetical protein
MPGAFLTRDLPKLFASSVFGEATGHIKWKGTDITHAILDDGDVTVQTGEGTGAIMHQCVVTAPSAQFAGIADKDPVTIGTAAYFVDYWEDDGTGVIRVYLKKDDE